MAVFIILTFELLKLVNLHDIEYHVECHVESHAYFTVVLTYTYFAYGGYRFHTIAEDNIGNYRDCSVTTSFTCFNTRNRSIDIVD
jgi:hypothetical protein